MKSFARRSNLSNNTRSLAREAGGLHAGPTARLWSTREARRGMAPTTAAVRCFFARSFWKRWLSGNDDFRPEWAIEFVGYDSDRAMKSGTIGILPHVIPSQTYNP